MSLLLLFRGSHGEDPPIEYEYFLNFDYYFEVGDPIPDGNAIPGGEVTWHFLRNQATVKPLPYSRQLNKLRRQITFYKGYIMPNQDPFEISKGGKLIDQLIFLDPLRTREDTISGTPTSTQSETGFIVDNISVNDVELVNEDGITFPIGTVIRFDCEAPGELGEDLGFDGAMIYFDLVSAAGLEIRISHPIIVLDAIGVR
jgi:hypothetical protein